MSDYNPRPEAAAILDAAWGFTQSVPYQVSARWLFYRLLQDGYLSAKGDYKKVIALLSKARKRFWKGWRPDTLADDTRDVRAEGYGYRSVEEWLWAFVDDPVFNYADDRPGMVKSYTDRWHGQSTFLVVCFEAAAMSAQFAHYLPAWVPRVAFKGDISIPAKWRIGEVLTWADQRYGMPTQVVYFGDLDPKGMEIPVSAMTDVEAWTRAQDFEWERAGLNPGDEARYDIAENPERPGTYQWEALDDGTAGELITSAVAPFIDRELGDACQDEDEKRMDAFREWWDGNQPSAEDLGLDG